MRYFNILLSFSTLLLGACGGSGSSSTGADTSGAGLYSTHCSSCHGSLATSAKRGITRAQLDNAIVNIPQMTGLSGLSSTTRDSIVQALN